MRYAATLASTAEREFLTLAKIGRDGREPPWTAATCSTCSRLDRRTDRVLPNGYCLLPPVRSCDKGNACHGCDHFATDRTLLPEIRRQLAATEQLVDARQAQHAARYGEPMSDDNIWLEQRLTEMRSMRLEITALEAQSRRHHRRPRRRRLGRTGYQTARPATSHEPPTRCTSRRTSRPRPNSDAPSALRRAAQAKQQAAATRADAAIRELLRTQQEITFRSVARTGGVSLDFLYAHPDLRRRVESLRAQQTAATSASEPSRRQTPTAASSTSSPPSSARNARPGALTSADLEQRLAAAHGETPPPPPLARPARHQD